MFRLESNCIAIHINSDLIIFKRPDPYFYCEQTYEYIQYLTLMNS